MFAVREPAVAGKFYPGDARTLERDVQRLIGKAADAVPAVALIGPHAGYMFSGAIAGQTYAQVLVPETAIVLCPNHTGMGARRSLWPSGEWRVPGGALRVDEGLADLLRRDAALEPDEVAHRFEHALEVHLPFLRARNPDVKIVPVCLAGLSPLECVALGEAIAAALRGREKKVLLVASTDMSHYIAADEAKDLDQLAIDRVLAMDPEGLYRVVQERDLSMCGFIPTTVTLAAARALGARSARLVRYGNSGEASGDYDRVVGYAGFVVV